jgi:hypothetical protein
MKHVQIRMKTSKDTRCECLRRDQDLGLYFGGYTKPHFPVPSIYCFSLISNKVDVRACEMNTTDMALSMLTTGGVVETCSTAD